MQWNTIFFVNSILLGVGLAMDAFSISVTCGLSNPRMSLTGMTRIASCFAAFQFAMPLLGWFFVRKAAETFAAFYAMIPWIALVILCFIGGKMLLEGIGRIRGGDNSDEENPDDYEDLPTARLLALGVATSIDALSVGLTIPDYPAAGALVCSLLIGVVTFVICSAGIRLGRRFGAALYGKGDLLGGIILIFIGLEIFFTK